MMKMNAAVTGACVGLAAGAAAYMMTNKKRHKTKQIKKKAEHARRAVGTAVNDISSLIK